MKSIYLLRHAKSDWDADYGDDHERPLAPRGKRAAARIGKLLAETSSVPGVIYASSAVRASDTATIAREAGEWDSEIHFRRDLYGAGLETVLAITQSLPGSLDSVLFVGHQPGWSHAVSALSGGSLVGMPTACLARIDFEVDDWTACGIGHGFLTRLIPPKALD
ncbi:histidine phosphatase family protein [Rhodothermus sp. AH-315-K08]|nr:histidine phosphatase family protein [Rhodothermus sp. AH-315-K08]